MTPNDHALLATWLEPHDGETLDDFLAAMDVPVAVCGIPTPDTSEEDQ